MSTESTITFPLLGLTETDYLVEMGYRKCEPQSEVLHVIHTHERQLAGRVKASYAFTLIEGECPGNEVKLENGTSLHVGDILGHLLDGATQFAVFAATAGLEFQDYYDTIKEQGDMLSLFILDTMGSCIAEKAGDLMELDLGKRIYPYRHTARFSPGYCGWTLNEQRDIFSILGNRSCGISLSDSCLMHPLKSISGVIGIGNRVNERKYGCGICKLETCYKRKNKKKYDTHE